jgi:hypothetical protein
MIAANLTRKHRAAIVDRVAAYIAAVGAIISPTQPDPGRRPIPLGPIVDSGLNSWFYCQMPLAAPAANLQQNFLF